MLVNHIVSRLISSSTGDDLDAMGSWCTLYAYTAIASEKRSNIYYIIRSRNSRNCVRTLLHLDIIMCTSEVKR